MREIRDAPPIAHAVPIYTVNPNLLPMEDPPSRVSFACRLPLYLLTLCFQTSKLLGKVVCLPLTYTLLYGFELKSLESWTFEGIGKEGILEMRLIDKIIGTFLGVVFSPPHYSHSFKNAMKGTYEFVILGKHHRFSLYHLSLSLRYQRVTYQEMIFADRGKRQHDPITITYPFSQVYTIQGDKIKAG